MFETEKKRNMHLNLEDVCRKQIRLQAKQKYQLAEWTSH